MKDRTRAYWPTRIMLAAAILLPIAVALLWWSAPQPMGPPMFDDSGDWGWPVVLAISAFLWLVGLVWMLRIFRGPRDEPPAWRYRRR
jgi:hypothetical protein